MYASGWMVETDSAWLATMWQVCSAIQGKYLFSFRERCWLTTLRSCIDPASSQWAFSIRLFPSQLRHLNDPTTDMMKTTIWRFWQEWCGKRENPIGFIYHWPLPTDFTFLGRWFQDRPSFGDAFPTRSIFLKLFMSACHHVILVVIREYLLPLLFVIILGELIGGLVSI